MCWFLTHLVSAKLFNRNIGRAQKKNIFRKSAHSIYLPDNGQIARSKKITFVIDDVRRFSSSLQEDSLVCRRLWELWTKNALGTGIVPLRRLEYILVLLLLMVDQHRSINTN